MKKIVAKEWLYLTSFVFVGGFVWVAIIALALSEAGGPGGLGPFRGILQELFGGKQMLQAWIFFLFPYFVFQFVRSIIWSIRILRRQQRA